MERERLTHFEMEKLMQERSVIYLLIHLFIHSLSPLSKDLTSMYYLWHDKYCGGSKIDMININSNVHLSWTTTCQQEVVAETDTWVKINSGAELAWTATKQVLIYLLLSILDSLPGLKYEV
jgi:hypothetical protein